MGATTGGVAGGVEPTSTVISSNGQSVQVATRGVVFGGTCLAAFGYYWRGIILWRRLRSAFLWRLCRWHICECWI